MSEKSFLLGVLDKAKTIEGFTDHHPTIILTSNGDLINYYANYYLFPWGLIMFIVDPQGNVANTDYCLRCIRYSSLSSIALDDVLNKIIDPSKVVPYTVSANDWNTFSRSFIESARLGDCNAGLEYVGYNLDCGNWYNVTGNKGLKDNIMDFNTDVYDVTGITYSNQRLLMDIDTIDQFTIRAKDWFRVKPIKEAVDSTPDLKRDLASYFRIFHIEVYPQWTPPEQYGVLRLAYKYGDMVMYKGKKYISLIDENNFSPEVSTYWKQLA